MHRLSLRELERQGRERAALVAHADSISDGARHLEPAKDRVPVHVGRLLNVPAVLPFCDQFARMPSVTISPGTGRLSASSRSTEIVPAGKDGSSRSMSSGG